jgi:hypothetical protein
LLGFIVVVETVFGGVDDGDVVFGLCITLERIACCGREGGDTKLVPGSCIHGYDG